MSIRDPEASPGPCAHIFVLRMRRAASAGDTDMLRRLGDAWDRGGRMADRDEPAPRDMVERTAEHALAIISRG